MMIALAHTEVLVSIDPTTEEPIAEVPVASVPMVRDAVNAARRAQPSWAARPVEERATTISPEP